MTTLDELTMNALLAAQPSSLIFDGNLFDSKGGTGTVEVVNLSTYNSAIRFTMFSSQTTIGRIELQVNKYGTAADLTLEVRSGLMMDGSTDGTLLKSIAFPAKIFTTGWISLPIDLSGLTVGAQYWIVLKKNGDSTNHLRLVGENYGEGTSSSDHPTWVRSGSSGAWTNDYCAHWSLYANTPGTYLLRHGIYGSNAKTLINYDANGNITEIWRWLPAADGSWMICDRMVPTLDANGMPVRWDVY